jgi:hypothetical protein
MGIQECDRMLDWSTRLTLQGINDRLYTVGRLGKMPLISPEWLVILDSAIDLGQVICDGNPKNGTMVFSEMCGFGPAGGKCKCLDGTSLCEEPTDGMDTKR